MRLPVALLILSLAVAARADTEQRIVVLRGRYKAGGPAIFNYAGEMRSAAYASGLADSIGLSSSERLRLERVVSRYAARPNPSANFDRHPLYVLLDEDGQSVTTRFGTSFTVVHPGGASELVSDGFVDLGAGAPERPFVQPWWSWFVASRARPVSAATRAVAQVAASAVRPATPASAVRPATLAAAPAQVAASVTAPRTTVYPANYTYVAPPQPVRVSAPIYVRRSHSAGHPIAAFTNSAYASAYSPQSTYSQTYSPTYAPVARSYTPAWRSYTPAWRAPAPTYTPAWRASTPSYAPAHIAQATFAHAGFHGRRR